MASDSVRETPCELPCVVAWDVVSETVLVCDSEWLEVTELELLFVVEELLLTPTPILKIFPCTEAPFEDVELVPFVTVLEVLSVIVVDFPTVWLTESVVLWETVSDTPFASEWVKEADSLLLTECSVSTKG